MTCRELSSGESSGIIDEKSRCYFRNTQKRKTTEDKENEKDRKKKIKEGVEETRLEKRFKVLGHD